MKDSEREIELYDYLEIIFKYKWFIVAATLAAGCVGWLLRPAPSRPTYEADAVLMVKEKPSTPEVDDMPTQVANGQNDLYPILALSDQVKQALSDTLNLDLSPVDLDGSLRVEILNPGIRLIARSSDPDRSIDVVRAWAELFAARFRSFNSEVSDEYYDYVIGQYQTAKDSLEQIENAQQRFSSQNQLALMKFKRTTLDSKTNALFQASIALQDSLAKWQEELEYVRNQIDALEYQGKSLFLWDGHELKRHAEHIAQGAPENYAMQLYAKIWSLEDENWQITQEIRRERRRIEDEDKLWDIYRGLYRQGLPPLAHMDSLAEQIQLGERQLAELPSTRADVSSPAYGELVSRLGTMRDQLEKEWLAVLELVIKYYIFEQQQQTSKEQYMVLEEERSSHPVEIADTPNPNYIELTKLAANGRVAYRHAALEPRTYSQQQFIERHLAGAVESDSLAFLLEYYNDLLQAYQDIEEKRKSAAIRFTDEREYIKTQQLHLQAQLDELRGAYVANHVSAIQLEDNITRHRAILQKRQLELTQLQDSLQTLEDNIADKLVQEKRMERDHKRLAETVERFSQLNETVRIDRAKTAGDIRILSQAWVARQLPEEPDQQKTAIAAGAGLLISSLLTLLIEYMRRARQRRVAVAE